MRPLIGVTGSDRGSFFSYAFIRIALFLAGARARWLTPTVFESPTGCQGFIIAGGADVDPALYGESLKEQLRRGKESARRHPLRFLWAALLFVLRRMIGFWRHRGLDRERDAMELSCIEYAIKHELPVLGICRGSQLLNVYFGGSLFQSIRDFYAETPQIHSFLPRKEIRLRPDSNLAHILARTQVVVNSLHNQSINRLGAGVVAVAQEPNGVVQAIERKGTDFVIGVQWHPEYLVQRREQRALFRAFVAAARRAEAQGAATQSRSSYTMVM